MATEIRELGGDDVVKDSDRWTFFPYMGEPWAALIEAWPEDVGQTVSAIQGINEDKISFFRQEVKDEDSDEEIVHEGMERQSRLDQIAEERRQVYGDPQLSHDSIGKTWTGLLQNHYGISLPHDIPDYVVAHMLNTMKSVRSMRVFHKDNYDDAHNYLRFGEDFQQREATTDSN